MYDVADLMKVLLELKDLTLLGTKKALTMTDAVMLTGLSRSHLYKLCCYKRIPYFKSASGGNTFFDRDELNAWMLSRRVKTDDELSSEAEMHILTNKSKK